MSETIVLKLNTQEEIIANLYAESDDGYLVTKPRSLHVMDMGNGQAGASFVPPMLLANDLNPILIPMHAVSMMTRNVNAEYERRYLESISGISLATSLNG